MSRSGLRSTEATLGGAHDRALLVDPHGHRDVDEPEQLVGDVARVDQARVRRRGGVDPLVRVLGIDVERNRHDGQAQRLEFGVQCLPPGQAGAAASIAGPGDEQHLAPVQRRQTERLPSRSISVGSAATAVLERAAGGGGRAERPDAVRRRRGRGASRAGRPPHATSSVPSSRSEPGAGTQTSPRHRPCGFGIPAGALGEVRRSMTRVEVV